MLDDTALPPSSGRTCASKNMMMSSVALGDSYDWVQPQKSSNSQHVDCSGWWYTYPSEKYESQLGWLFQIYGKIKNVPNHQPVLVFKYSWAFAKPLLFSDFFDIRCTRIVSRGAGPECQGSPSAIFPPSIFDLMSPFLGNSPRIFKDLLWHLWIFHLQQKDTSDICCEHVPATWLYTCSLNLETVKFE